jgi:hypothetical protein
LEVEAAADAVVNGTVSGVLSFSRATGGIIELEVERLAAPPAGTGTSGDRRNSDMVVLVAGMQFSSVSFAALIESLGRNIYRASPTLEYAVNEVMNDAVSVGDFMSDLEECQVNAGSLFCLQLQVFFSRAMLFRVVSGTLSEDLALKMNLKSLLTPWKGTSSMVIGGLMLDKEGKAFWAAASGTEVSYDSLATSCDTASNSFQDGGEEVFVPPMPRRRGRPRKTETPQVESQVKRTLHSNSEGYNYEMIPYQPSRRKESKIPAAAAPAVLQIEEMQRIGVEECQIDPAALTVERLMKQREGKKQREEKK